MLEVYCIALDIYCIVLELIVLYKIFINEKLYV